MLTLGRSSLRRGGGGDRDLEREYEREERCDWRYDEREGEARRSKEVGEGIVEGEWQYMGWSREHNCGGRDPLADRGTTQPHSHNKPKASRDRHKDLSPAPSPLRCPDLLKTI